MTKMINIQKFKLSYFLNSTAKDINHFDSNDYIQARRYTMAVWLDFWEKKWLKWLKFRNSNFLTFWILFVKDINHFDSNDCIQARRYTIEVWLDFWEKITKMIKILAIQTFLLFEFYY